MPSVFLTERPPRRGFLRSLVMAPAAALATHRLIVPPQTIIAPDGATARLAHHVAGVEQAMRDLFPGANVRAWGNCLNGWHASYAERFAAGDRESVASVGFDASLPRDQELRS